MDKFKIFETNRFLGDLENDFRGQQEKIKKKLVFYVYPQLKQNPFFGKNIKKLTNYKPDTWRYRIGDYRFFYTVEEKTIFMVAADNRKDAY